MSTDSTREERVIDLIEQFIKPNLHLVAMERIHRNFKDEERKFDNWEEVVDLYSDYSWNADKIGEFTSIVKQIRDTGSLNIRETLFKITNEEEFDNIISELERNPYNPDVEAAAREGFQWEILEDKITGRYIHVDVRTEINHTGEMVELVEEGSISFEVLRDPSGGTPLISVHSTSVIDVQKFKSIIRRKVDFDISVYADFSTYPDSTERIHRFLNDIVEDNLRITRVDKISLSGAAEQEELGIELEGVDILNTPEVDRYLEDNWEIKSLEAVVRYGDNEILSLRFAGSEVMCYLALEGITDHDKGQEAMDILREHFVSVF
jgi:hypothetical protein